jgi:hypothetical protein
VGHQLPYFFFGAFVAYIGMAFVAGSSNYVAIGDIVFAIITIFAIASMLALICVPFFPRFRKSRLIGLLLGYLMVVIGVHIYALHSLTLQW